MSGLRDLLRRTGVDVIRTSALAAARAELEAWRVACDAAPDVLSLVIDARLADVARPFVVQIGANDGLRDDDLHRHLVTGRWRGVLVEPQPGPFARLRATYGGVDGLAFENCAVAAEPGTLTLWGLSGHHGDAQLDVFTRTDRAYVEQLRAELGVTEPVERFDVPAITYAELLARHGSPHVDLLVIDTEGDDAVILDTVDLAHDAPTVIQFEHLFLAPHVRLAAYRRLIDHGYRLLPHQRDTVAFRER